MRSAVGCAHAALAALALTFALTRAPVAFAATTATTATSAPATTSATSATGASADGTVTVRQQPVTAEYAAYARVRPIAVVAVRAVEPGTVTAVRVEPGSPVTAGESLATLSGPEVQALLVGRRGAVHSAQTRLVAARRALTADTRQLAVQLSTRQSVAAAQSAVAAAAAALQTAQAQLRVAQDLTALRAPSAGAVLAINAGSGERVAAGQAVLTLQPSGSLWLEATYYGEDAAEIRVGMTGRFEAAAGGAPVAVKVVSVLAALGADGGEKVGLVATRSAPRSASGAQPAVTPPWLDGEWGTVTLAGPARPMIPVPTAAVIMDRARWWVLVRTPSGDRPQPVVPGPTRGWSTFIEKGLEPGQQVVVQNAYLEFHRGIAQRYTPPD